MMNTDANNQQTSTLHIVKSVEEFVQWVQKDVQGQSLLYRGLADSKWEVEAAASRRVRGAGKPGEKLPSNEAMKDYIIMQLLGKARLHGLDEHNGQPLSDLKLLAKLQHHGAATCMIDFTHDPLVALWFACLGEFEKDGKVVVLNNLMTDAITDVGELKEGIKHFLDEQNLRTWHPIPRDSRVVAQHSVFVFGEAVIEGYCYDEVHVPTAAKKEILTALHEKFEMTEESLFGDFTGFALANAHGKPCYEEYSADAYFEIANEHWLQDEFEQAKHCCDKTIEQDHGHARAYFMRGDCYKHLQKVEDAIGDYTQAIAIYSGHEHDQTQFHVKALIARGKAYESSDIESKFEKAMDDYTEAIDIVSDKGVPTLRSLQMPLLQAYYRRGRVKAKFDKHEKAIEDFTSAIEVFPDIAMADHREPKTYRALRNARFFMRHIAPMYLERSKSHHASGNAGLAAKDEKKARDFDLNLRNDSDGKNYVNEMYRIANL